MLQVIESQMFIDLIANGIGIKFLNQPGN